MDFATLALISLIALVGPALAGPTRWNLPVTLGELLAGIAFGPTGFGVLAPKNATFTLLADVGFGLVMFVAGTHVPVRDPRLRGALRSGALRAVVVGLLAVGVGTALAKGFGTGHAALYAVLLASSSAALVLPVVDSLGLGGPAVLDLLPQVAIADAACIVALPLAVDPRHALRAALGSLAVIGCSVVLFVALRQLERTGLRRRLHRISERRKFALELRVNLMILFALAALAVRTHVSIMLAGFCFGLAVAGTAEPRRLARQLFAVTEGFFGPVFFVWLGASLGLRDLGQRPSFIGLGLLLGAGAVATHLVAGRLPLSGLGRPSPQSHPSHPRHPRQPVPLALLASAQLGVPVAAVTVGDQLHVLRSGEGAALIVGALVTIAAMAAAGAVAARRPELRAPSTATGTTAGP